MTAIPSSPAGLCFDDALRPPPAEERPPRADHLLGDGADVPRQLGGAKIIRLIGEGGMGRVYLGHHTILDIDVAVKVLHRRSGDRGRFLAEARLAARIQHPNIVRILNAGIEHDLRFLVLEYVAGQTLKQLVRKHGRLPWREAAGYICQAANGLAAAHRQAIIHRDVKPSNMLLNAAGGLKVADLGLARYMIDAEPGAVGKILGTPAYMAPEQAREANAVTPAADVYSLGVSLFCLLAGKEPFAGGSTSDILAAHRQRPVPDLHDLRPDLPEQLSSLVMQMMAKDPGQRPADGAAVAARLEEIMERVTVTTVNAASPPRIWPRQHWLVGTAAAAAMALMLVGWSRWHGPPAETAGLAAPPPAPRLAAAALQAPPPADPWQTPARAVFVLGDKLPAVVLAELDRVCLASGLPLVERQRLDALVREQDLVASGHADPATAGRIGRLVGGHIALFVNLIEDRLEVRTVLVETGELVACRLVAPGEIGPAVEAGLATALAQLPIQGRVTSAAGKLSVSAGIRHGLRVGDRLELRRGDGGVLTSATVTAVERDRAAISVQPPRDDCGGALAVRPAAP